MILFILFKHIDFVILMHRAKRTKSLKAKNQTAYRLRQNLLKIVNEVA